MGPPFLLFLGQPEGLSEFQASLAYHVPGRNAANLLDLVRNISETMIRAGFPETVSGQLHHVLETGFEMAAEMVRGKCASI